MSKLDTREDSLDSFGGSHSLLNCGCWGSSSVASFVARRERNALEHQRKWDFD